MGSRISIFVLALVLIPLGVRAQYDVEFAHYFDMETSFNPAAAGKQDRLNVTAAYAMQFAGFEHNPNSIHVAGDLPFYALGSYNGVGLQLLNDQIGAFTHQKVAAQYALRKKFLGGTISIGVQATMLNEQLDGSKLDAEDSSDPALVSSQVNGSGLDLAAGLYYQHGQWYVGASAQHLTAPLIELGDRNELQIDRTYYLTGGYNIKLRNPFVTIHPSFLVRSDGVAYRGDLTCRVQYTNDKKKMYIGAGYSPTNSATLMIGGSFHGINVGYSYEVYTSAVGIGNGSHELFVGYQTELNLYKKGKNKHKSVRLL